MVSWYHHTAARSDTPDWNTLPALAGTVASFHPGIRLGILLAITAGWLKSDLGPGALGQQVRDTVFSTGRPPSVPHICILKLWDTKAVSWLPVSICFRQDS